MTPEAWTFFTGDSLALIGILGQQLTTRKKIDRTATTAETAVANTTSISNGAIRHLLDDMETLKDNHAVITDNVKALSDDVAFIKKVMTK